MRCLCLALCLLTACGDGDHRSSDAGTDGPTNGDAIGLDGDPECANPGSIPALHAQLVTDGLSSPLYVAQPPGSTDLYVVEKGGTIRIVRGGAIAGTFLTVSDVAQLPAEGGLLGLAFHKDYATNGRFFVYLTLSSPSNRSAVREYHRSAGNADVADGTSVAELVSESSSGYDIGGTVAFGPDGKLYVGIGDAANPPDAQDLSSKHGKILRMDVDTPGTAPAGNLAGGDPFVWDYGVRNPFRFSFDRGNGDLYIGDAGDDEFEEVDIETPNTGHFNYGWDVMEGKHCNGGGTSCDTSGKTLPAYERAHDAGYSVLIGGVVYRGAQMPCLRGRYIFGINGTGHVLSFIWNGSTVTSESELSDAVNVDVTQIVGFGEDNAGEIYFVTMDGKLYEIVPG